MYTNYFWTHQEGDSVSVAVRFQSSHSHRWRTGARLNHSILTEKGFEFTPYIGAAYEYEFDGKAKARVYGHSIDEPALKGNTGAGELGLRFKPSTASLMSLDFSAQGYTGTCEGVSGTFNCKVRF